MSKEDTASEIVSYLMDLGGWSLNGAAAAAGNAWLESGLNPIAPSNDGSNGLWQWRDASDVNRLTRLKRWCAANRYDWRTIKAQCAYCVYETKEDFSTLYSQLQGTERSIENLTLNFCDVWERPAKQGRVPDVRIKYAKQARQAFLDRNHVASDDTRDKPVVKPKDTSMLPATLITSLLGPVIQTIVQTVIRTVAEDLKDGKLDFQNNSELKRLPSPEPDKGFDIGELIKQAVEEAAKQFGKP